MYLWYIEQYTLEKSNMKLILIPIILFSSLFAVDPFKLTKDDIKVINTKYFKKQIKVRYKRFYKFLKEAQEFDTIKKLNRVNSFINKILPQHDSQSQNALDYWSTPKEFLIDGRGDCEEYAMTKYFTLVKLDMEKEKFYLAIVKVKGTPTMHLVLLYFETPKSIPLVLDNLSWKVLDLNKRKDLTVQVVFNEFNSYILKNNYLDKKVNINWGELNKWEDILKRINLGK